MKRIIGVCGKKRCGKDTIAYCLSTNGYINKKLSKPLKVAVSSIFNFSQEQIEGDLKDVIDKTWNITPRQAMQFIGTDVLQFQLDKLTPGIGRNIWVRSLIDDIDKNHDDDKIVISDIRFIHEVKALKKRYGDQFLLVKVERNVETNEDHVSEKEVEELVPDVLIENNDTMTSLYNKVEDLIK